VLRHGLGRGENPHESKPGEAISKSPKSGKVHRTKSAMRLWKRRGPKEIDDKRCRAIQQALIREKIPRRQPTGR